MLSFISNKIFVNSKDTSIAAIINKVDVKDKNFIGTTYFYLV